MNPDLDLRRMRYFVTVARELHFGRAAERLHVAQPALSQQIRQFEHDLGAKLLDRTTRSVRLTAAGERLLDRAQLILAECEQAVDEVRHISNGDEGTVRLGFIGSATYHLMPDVVRRLRQRIPRAAVELRGELMSAQLAESLHVGSLDVAVLRPTGRAAGLALQTLREEAIVVALPDGHPKAQTAAIRLVDLSNEHFVSYPIEDSTTAQTQRDACLRAGFEPGVVAQVAETSTLVTFVASGLGVALVPEGVQSVQIPGVTYRPIEDTTLTVPLVLASRHSRARHPLTDRTVQVIKSCYGL